jgi:actin-related protein 8
VQPTGGANDADSASNQPEASGIPIDVVDVDEESKVPERQPSAQSQGVPMQPAPSAPEYPGGYPIDVPFEASKLPLDVAIFNSARAAGGDEKIRKYLQAVLVIGGTALIPGTAHALESR